MDSTSDDVKILQSLTCVKGSSVFFDMKKFIEQQHEFLKTMEPFKTLALQIPEADTSQEAGCLSMQNRLDSTTNEIPKAFLLISMPLSESKLKSIELDSQLRKVEYGNYIELLTKAGDTDLSHMFEFKEVKDVHTPDEMKTAITKFLQEVSPQKYVHATIILNGHGHEGGICLESGPMSYESLYGHIQQCYLNVETTGTNLKGLMVLNGTCYSYTGEKDHPADPRIVVINLTSPDKPYTTSKVWPEKDEHGNMKARHKELEQEAREQYRETEKRLQELEQEAREQYRETEKRLRESGHVIKSYAVTNEGKIVECTPIV